MAMIKCPGCHQRISEFEQRCASCGRDLPPRLALQGFPAEPAPLPAPPSHPAALERMGLTLVLAGVTLAVASDGAVALVGDCAAAAGVSMVAFGRLIHFRD